MSLSHRSRTISTTMARPTWRSPIWPRTILPEMDRYLCGPAPSIGMAISIWRCAPTSPPRCWCSWASATEHSGHRSLSPPAAAGTLSPWAISTRTARPTLSRRPPIVSLCSSITAPTDGRSGRVDLNFRHRFVFGFVEGREHGFGRAESGEVRFGFFKSPVIGEGRAVAPLRALHVDIFYADGMVLMHRKHQSRDAALAGVVVLHLGDGNVMAFGHMPVAICQDSEVDIRLVHHAQRFADGIIVAGREMLHHQREEALPQACIHSSLPMFRQVERRTADHRALMNRHASPQ